MPTKQPGRLGDCRRQKNKAVQKEREGGEEGRGGGGEEGADSIQGANIQKSLQTCLVCVVKHRKCYQTLCKDTDTACGAAFKFLQAACVTF